MLPSVSNGRIETSRKAAPGEARLSNDFSSIRRLDIRQLRQFIILAEELHFGRAAMRLGIAQPPLSQAIKRLEGEIGAELFERSNRRVELTPAGRAFLTEVQAALRQIELAASLAKKVASGDAGQLKVGFVSSALFRALPTLMRMFSSIAPGISIKLVEKSSKEQAEALRDGGIDLGLLIPAPSLLDGLASMTVERARMIAAIPSGWELAKRPSIELRDLAGLPLILVPYGEHSDAHNSVFSACRMAGFEPNVVQEAKQVMTMLGLVAADFGAAFIVESAARWKPEGVTFLEITDRPESLGMTTVAAWNPTYSSAARDKLINALRQTFGDT